MGTEPEPEAVDPEKAAEPEPSYPMFSPAWFKSAIVGGAGHAPAARRRPLGPAAPSPQRLLLLGGTP